MGKKTLLILLLVALSAILVLQNTSNVSFSFLWAALSLAKSTIILGALAIGFIMGVLVAHPKTSNGDDNSSKNSKDDDYLN
jgi:uncharacterized integral membrane protein